MKNGLKELDKVASHLEERGAPYQELENILTEALQQSSQGKGLERHANGPMDLWQDQPICTISRQVGLGYPLGQAMKKTIESQRLEGERGVAELLGAIVYLAGAIKVRRELDET